MIAQKKPKPTVTNQNSSQGKKDAWGREPLHNPHNTVQAKMKKGEKEPDPIVQYMVKSGDSPSSIANLFGVSIWDLARFNQGKQEGGGFFKPIGDGDYHRYWKSDGVNWKLNPGDYLNITKDADLKKEKIKSENKKIEEAVEEANAELKDNPNSELSIKMTTQVLNLISTDAAITTKFGTAKQILDANKKGLVIHDFKTMDTWKSTWSTGNQYVSKETVAATKSSFNGGVKTLKVVKGLGVIATFAGGGISIYQYIQGEISGAKLATDLVFTGIAFVPVVGWIISGVYFLGDAIGWDKIGASMESITKKNQAIHGPGWRLMGSGANK